MIRIAFKKNEPSILKMPVSPPPSFGVAILAAGASRRMGAPKPLLPWKGRTILEHLITTWAEAGASQISVVFDPRNTAVRGEMDRLKIIHRIENTRPEEGMMSSAKAAAAWQGWSASHSSIALALIDQPQIPAHLITRLAAFSTAHPASICQPECAGRRGHPVFFPRTIFSCLAASPAETLRDFIRQHRRSFLPWEDPAILEDMDTPEDYRTLRERE